MPATVTLLVTKGALTGQEFAFDERGTSIIGRSKDCSPRLPDDDQHRTVSRHHCLLDVNPPDIRVRDFGSLNGTYVNGVKIGQRDEHQSAADAAVLDFPEHDIGDGDEVRVGETVFLVSVRAASNAVEPVEAVQAVQAAQAMEPTVEGNVSPAEAAHAEPPPADPDELLRRLLDRAKAAGRDARHRQHAGDVAAFDGYMVLRELGRGGMGAVYLARDQRSGQEVALKVMLPQVAASAHARARFLREVELTRKLRHENIAAVYDVGNSDGGFFFTVEYCRGGSLDQLVDRCGGTIAVDEALPLILQTLQGLQHAHGNSVVHRDLSPQNILLGGSEAAPVAKVCDFGIAKAFDQAGLSGLTRTGAAAGKPLFMPRQQVVNFKNARPEVDVWAAAACLYWMLTGTSPRDFTAHKDIWQVVLQDDAVPIRKRRASVPKPLAEVIDEALRDNPEIGFRNANAFRRALERVT